MTGRIKRWISVNAVVLAIELAARGARSQSIGTFNILRDPSSCKRVAFSTLGDPTVADPEACSVLDWRQIQQMRAYTTYEQSGTAIEARIGPLYALASDDRLDYECPPDQYNGFDYRYSFCQLASNATIMAVAHVAPDENSLLGLDAILSGKPFPETVEENQPPFGAARYRFDAPIPMQTVGFLSICDVIPPDGAGQQPAVACEGVDDAQTLDLRGLQYSAQGVFSLFGLNYTGPSVWIHDDERQLLHLTAGPAQAQQGFWFNQSGFYLADYAAGSCSWFDFCNFACEVYNYDSRFLDYIGTWNITGKFGMESFEPLEVKVYLGNAIDAAGVFPVLMYISIDEGYYLGLDKLDTTIGTGGSSFWYTETKGGAPNFALDYPLSADLGCPGTTEEWLGTSEGEGTGGGGGASSAAFLKETGKVLLASMFSLELLWLM